LPFRDVSGESIGGVAGHHNGGDLLGS